MTALCLCRRHALACHTECQSLSPGVPVPRWRVTGCDFNLQKLEFCNSCSYFVDRLGTLFAQIKILFYPYSYVVDFCAWLVSAPAQVGPCYCRDILHDTVRHGNANKRQALCRGVRHRGTCLICGPRQDSIRGSILIEEYLPGLADNPAAECHFTSMCPYRRKLNGSTICVGNDIFNELRFQIAINA